MSNSALDWRFEEDEEWVTGDPGNLSSPRRRRGRRVVAVLGLTLLIGLVGGGIYFWQRYEQGIAAIRRDIERAVSTEQTARYVGDDAGLSAMLDPQADPGWRQYMERTSRFRGRPGFQPVLSQEGQVEQIDLRGDTAQVQVLIPPADPRGTAYQELRFYRSSGNRWLRTAPDPEWWGRATEDAQTAHFRFVYHPRDRTAVRETAADVETFYTRLLSDLGAEDRVNEPLVIQIEPRVDLMTFRFRGGELAVPAPGLLPAPAGTSPGVALRQTISQAIVQEVMRNAGIDNSRDGPGLAFAYGVISWEGWDWAGGIPPWGQPGALAALREARQRGDLGPLDTLTFGRTMRGDRRAGSAQAALLADYVAGTYGRERFAGILRAWPERKSWREIVPAVLGVSFDEFEAGWLAHLDRVLESPRATAWVRNHRA